MEPVQSQNAPPIGSAGETCQAMDGCPKAVEIKQEYFCGNLEITS